MVIKRSNIILFAVLFLAVILLVEILAYRQYNSESFGLVQRLITSNEAFRNEFGLIQSEGIRIRSYEGSGSEHSGHEKYKISINGSKSNGHAVIELDRSERTWKIRYAQVEPRGKESFLVKSNDKVTVASEQSTPWVTAPIAGLLAGALGIVLVLRSKWIASKMFSFVPAEPKVILVTVSGIIWIVISLVFLLNTANAP